MYDEDYCQTCDEAVVVIDRHSEFDEDGVYTVFDLACGHEIVVKRSSLAVSVRDLY